MNDNQCIALAEIPVSMLGIAGSAYMIFQEAPPPWLGLVCFSLCFLFNLDAWARLLDTPPPDL